MDGRKKNPAVSCALVHALEALCIANCLGSFSFLPFPTPFEAALAS